MFRITGTRVFVLLLLIAGGWFYRVEIKRWASPHLKNIKRQYGKTTRNVHGLSDLVSKVPSSLKTIKSVNQKTYTTEKMLNEILPENNKKETREYLGNYDRKKLDETIRPHEKK